MAATPHPTDLEVALGIIRASESLWAAIAACDLANGLFGRVVELDPASEPEMRECQARLKEILEHASALIVVNGHRADLLKGS